MLDVGCGCGYGELALYFALSGKQVTGIDIDDKALQSAKQLRDFLKIKNLDFQYMDALDIRVSGFTAAYCTDFYEHITSEKHVIHLKNIYSSLDERGIYIIRAPHIDNIRQNARPDHIGLRTYVSMLSEANACGFSCSFMIGHTALSVPMKYHFFLNT